MRGLKCIAGLVLLLTAAAPGQAHSIAYRLDGAGFNAHGVAGDPGLRSVEKMITTFDGNDAISFDAAHSSNFAFYTGRHVGQALAPIGDTSQYAAIGKGGRMSFDLRQFSDASTHLASVSVDVGSIDTYNFIQILGLTSTGDVDYDNPLFTLTGAQMIAAGGRDGRLTFGFDDSVNVGGIRLGSSGIAFEFDSLAISVNARRGASLLAPEVPEPASWAMMLGGFTLVGGTMRARRRTAQTFA